MECVTWSFSRARRLRSRRKSEPPTGAEAQRQIAELTASRRIIVDAYEVERRRIERDLHDGTQQHLVTAMMQLGEASLSPALQTDPALAELIVGAQNSVKRGLDALRKTVRGIHPQVLMELGLAAALEDVASAAGERVRIFCPNPLPTLPEGVLAAAYFFATEALTNAAKYAPGAGVTVLLAADEHLRVSVMDDGPGGAVIREGRGLAGMRERLAAFGGDLSISSPPGGPTQVAASIPLLLHRGESGVGPVSPVDAVGPVGTSAPSPAAPVGASHPSPAAPVPDSRVSPGPPRGVGSPKEEGPR